MPSRPDSVADRGSEPGYAGVVRSYLIQLVGPSRSGRATERALDELAILVDGSGAPELAAVRKAAQRAGLDALDAEVRGLARRFRGAASGQNRCAGVVRRLRERAEGRPSSAEDLYAFYRHLDRCEECAAVTRRFEAADWYLEVQLGRPNHRPELPQIMGSLPSSAPDMGPLPSSAPKAAAPVVGRPRRGLDALFLVVIAVVAFAVGFLILHAGRSAPKRAGPVSTAGPVAPATRKPAVPPATPIPDVAARGDGTPFVVAGARFAVFVNAAQRWSVFAKTVPAGPGKRWLLVTVRVRNLTLPRFDPRILPYRLVGPGRVSYTPNPGRGTGAAVPSSPKPTGRGTLVQAELAFVVPKRAAGLRLAFEPAGPTGAHVVVALPS